MSDDYERVIAHLSARAARAEARLAAVERHADERLAQLERAAAALETESEQLRRINGLPPRVPPSLRLS